MQPHLLVKLNATCGMCCCLNHRMHDFTKFAGGSALVEQSKCMTYADTKHDTSCACPAAQSPSTTGDHAARRKAFNTMMWWVLANGTPTLQPRWCSWPACIQGQRAICPWCCLV